MIVATRSAVRVPRRSGSASTCASECVLARGSIRSVSAPSTHRRNRAARAARPVHSAESRAELVMASRRWFFEASEFLGAEVRDPLMQASPSTLEDVLRLH